MTAPLMQRLLETAYQTGEDVVVQLKQANGETYRGRVQDLDDEGFTLFHSGRQGGILWAFARADVATVGLLVGVPQVLTGFESSIQNPVF